jgi:acetyl esterase/lipase
MRIAANVFAFYVSAWLLAQAVHAAPPVGTKHIYKTVDGRDLAIYVTKPDQWKAGDSRPAILFFHGGGWTGGAPGQFTEHSRYFASRGIVCFQAQYRLLNRKNTDPPTVCIRDARSAMRWVRSRAQEFGIDPNRIASAGGSAGGHLAATLGTINAHDEPGEDTSVSVRSNAMILFNPVFDNGPDGWGQKRVGDRYREFSPMHNITADTPPAIVFLGDSDSLIPVSTLEHFQNNMQAAGVRCESKVFAGMPHGFFNPGKYGNKPYVETVRAADRFLASLGWVSGEPTISDPETDSAE